MSEETRPSVIVVAGPNGAGKSTTAPALLTGSDNLRNYLNPDLIARGLAPLDPASVAFAAGRIVLRRIAELGRLRESFAFETTLSGRSYAPILRELKGAGYRVGMLFLWVQSEDLAVARVAERVRTGGHGIPEPVIRRRYAAGLRNFFSVYRPLLEEWRVVDNSRLGEPSLVAQASGDLVKIAQSGLWNALEGAYGNG